MAKEPPNIACTMTMIDAECFVAFRIKAASADATTPFLEFVECFIFFVCDSESLFSFLDKAARFACLIETID
jgi:hypothetical protein